MNEENLTTSNFTNHKKFANNQIKTKISFVLGLSLIVFSAIIIVIVYIIQPNPWIAVAIYIVIIITGITGVVIASLSFKDERNVFNILGLIFSIAATVTFIAALITIAALIPQL